MNNKTLQKKNYPKGMALLDDPALNKGTAFTNEEREHFGLTGLLPDEVENIDRQVERVLGHLELKSNDLNPRSLGRPHLCPPCLTGLGQRL